MLVALATAELVVALAQLGRHTDAPATFANSLVCALLILALLTVLRKRHGGLARPIIAACLVLGLLRALVAIWGAPVGWILTESIDAGGNSTVSQTHVNTLAYDAGAIPAHLINDTTRFNFYRKGDPDRQKLPVSVIARAYVAGQGSLLISSSSPIRISVGSETTELSPPIVNWERGISVAGEEPVEISVVPTGVDEAALTVHSRGLVVYAEPTTGPLMAVRRLLGQLAGFLDLATFALALWMSGLFLRAWLRGLSRSQRLQAAVIAFTILLTVLPDLLTWFSQHDQLIVLSGGDDWLTYETFARDIRDNSPLMLLGFPIGHGEPFYYQVLYPYAVAVGHLMVGESVQGIVLIQLLGAAAVMVLAYRSMPRGVYPMAALTLILLGTGVAREWSQLAQQLLSENLLMILFALLIFVVSRLRPVPSMRSLALVGLLLGLAGVARSTTWLAVPFLVVLLCRQVGRKDFPHALAAILVPMLLVASLVPVRNLIVSGNPMWLPANGSVTFAMGNVPPGHKIQTEPWLQLSKQYDPSLVAVAEAVVDVPGQVATRLVDKTIYVLGFPRSMDTANPFVFWPVLSLWLLAPLGALSRRQSRLGLTCLILAGTHILALVIVHPQYYYYRLEIPATLPLTIWDSIAVSNLLAGLPDPSWSGNKLKRAAGRLGLIETTPLH